MLKLGHNWRGFAIRLRGGIFEKNSVDYDAFGILIHKVWILTESNSLMVTMKLVRPILISLFSCIELLQYFEIRFSLDAVDPPVLMQNDLKLKVKHNCVVSGPLNKKSNAKTLSHDVVQEYMQKFGRIVKFYQSGDSLNGFIAFETAEEVQLAMPTAEPVVGGCELKLTSTNRIQSIPRYEFYF